MHKASLLWVQRQKYCNAQTSDLCIYSEPECQELQEYTVSVGYLIILKKFQYILSSTNLNEYLRMTIAGFWTNLLNNSFIDNAS